MATVRLQCVHASGASNAVSSLDGSPKVFDLAPINRLVSLNVNISRGRTSSRSFPRALCISSRALLDILVDFQAHHTAPFVVPWMECAENPSWIDKSVLRISKQHAQFGHRLAGFDWSSFLDPK